MVAVRLIRLITIGVLGLAAFTNVATAQDNCEELRVQVDEQCPDGNTEGMCGPLQDLVATCGQQQPEDGGPFIPDFDETSPPFVFPGAFECVVGDLVVTLVEPTTAVLDEGQVVQFDIELPSTADAAIPVIVTLTPSNGLAVDRRELNFNGPTDATKQRVLARFNAASGLLDRAQLSLTLNWRYPSEPDCVQPTRVLKWKLKKRSGCGGNAMGDPHLLSLDGVAFDFMKPGVFTMVGSKRFAIQGAIRKCARVGCVYGVAVQFGQSIVRLVAENGRIVVAKGTTELKELTVERSGRTNNQYRIFFVADPASYMDVTMGSFDGIHLINLSVRLSPYLLHDGVAGLLGNGNGNPRDDDRNTATLSAAFTITGANLFTCTRDCGKVMKAAFKEDAIPLDPVALLHQGYTVVPPASIPFQSSVLIPVRRLREEAELLPPVRRRLLVDDARVAQLCAEVITTVPYCDKYVTDQQFYIDACTSDTIALDTMATIDDTKLEYLRECRRLMDAAIVLDADRTVDSKMEAKEDRSDLALGSSASCPEDCSGHGACQLNGCKCDDGFTGFACMIAY